MMELMELLELGCIMVNLNVLAGCPTVNFCQDLSTGHLPYKYFLVVRPAITIKEDFGCKDQWKPNTTVLRAVIQFVKATQRLQAKVLSDTAKDEEQMR